MNRNGNHQNVALLDVVEDETPETQTGPFYDSNNPVLKPAKAVEAGNRKTWKRKLIGWGFLLLLVGGAAIALYLLLRVNRVPVRVQADSRRDPQSAKSKTDVNNSENGLTSDAINIARAPSTITTQTASPTSSSAASTISSQSELARSRHRSRCRVTSMLRRASSSMTLHQNCRRNRSGPHPSRLVSIERQRH